MSVFSNENESVLVLGMDTLKSYVHIKPVLSVQVVLDPSGQAQAVDDDQTRKFLPDALH